MSNEKRLTLFLVLAFALMMGMPYVQGWLGLLPPPAPAAKPGAKPAPDAVAAKKPKEAPPKPAAEAANEAPAVKPDVLEKPRTAIIDRDQLVLGAAAGKALPGYRLVVHLDQEGAGVASVESTQYEAEFIEGKPRGPLNFILPDLKAPPSFAVGFVTPANAVESGMEVPPDLRLWEVERNRRGGVVHDIKDDPAQPGRVTGQEVRFLATVGSPKVLVTKRYQLRPGSDTFDLAIDFSHPADGQEDTRSLRYVLAGPHGIPIEGEWYTSTFRDVFLGQVDGSKVNIVTRPGYTIAKDGPERFTESPIQFAGVENQYFAVLVKPEPRTPEERWIAETDTTLVHKTLDDSQKSDVSVNFMTKPIVVGPNRPVIHRYRVYAGPKAANRLKALGASDLAAYRKGWKLWFLGDLGASSLSQWVIAPMLDKIFALTTSVANLFGWKKGSYGIAIILLTITVRLIMFPISRKQAISAKKMQDLQPLMADLKEKYKDDKERITKETFALYKRHGVNPVGGCLPALIQLPIFVGLWQTLNNSVALRHARFLYIRDLAAPDMLFRLPFELPYINIGHYFNLLPFVVVTLMLIQMKLFSPPPTTPEAEMQQKMMKYMMVFMAFMFYKVPSGLGIYFITSSLWAIGERKLLPRMVHPPLPTKEDDDLKSGRGGDGKKEPGGWLSKKFEMLMEEAANERTIRNKGNDNRPAKGGGGKPKTRPGKRR